MSHHNEPGVGATPGIEDQALQAATGKPSQVPGHPDSPNADGFDLSAAAERLRPQPDEGPGDPRRGAGDPEDEEPQ